MSPSVTSHTYIHTVLKFWHSCCTITNTVSLYTQRASNIELWKYIYHKRWVHGRSFPAPRSDIVLSRRKINRHFSFFLLTSHPLNLSRAPPFFIPCRLIPPLHQEKTTIIHRASGVSNAAAALFLLLWFSHGTLTLITPRHSGHTYLVFQYYFYL